MLWVPGWRCSQSMSLISVTGSLCAAREDQAAGEVFAKHAAHGPEVARFLALDYGEKVGMILQLNADGI